MVFTYLHLFLCGLVVIALCIGVYLVRRFTKFGKISPVAQQIIIGLFLALHQFLVLNVVLILEMQSLILEMLVHYVLVFFSADLLVLLLV